MSDNLVGFIADNIFLISLALALIVFIVINESTRALRKFTELTPEEAVQLLNRDNTVMLDVRETNETVAGSIAEAQSYPASSFQNKLADLEAHKDHPVIAFCANGLKATKICRLLTKSGFNKVYHLRGGLAAWTEANLPVAKK